MWKKYITRRLAVQVAQAWNFGWGEVMQKIYGVSLYNTLVFRDDTKTEYYVDEIEHKNYIDGLCQLLQDKTFLKIFHKEAQASLENILFKTKIKFNQDFSKLNNKELVNLYENFVLPKVVQFYIRMWTVFNIGEPLANIVKEKLQNHLEDEEKITEYLLKLSSPKIPNDILKRRMDILRLKIEQDIKNKEEQYIDLLNHAKKFKHVPMFDFDHEPGTLDCTLGEMEAIANPKQELQNLKQEFTNRKKDITEILESLQADEDLILLLEFLQENVWLRDHRDMIRQKLNLELRKFYLEVGKRLGLNIKQVAILTNKEIINYLLQNKHFPKDITNKREKAFLLIQKGEEVQIYSGDEAVRIARQELPKKEKENKTLVAGTTGAKGKATGIAKIIYTNKDLYKINPGDIMITCMTRQDFVPYIKKTAALVTDEGSVTCHAAIIARELKIPCIVNTKNATQIFKDGDKVEINADTGTIRKI